ncbi:putative outer mitochondrial membrane transport complex protein [Elsinoe australis]|uniref:Putative outer mitochondrial membrane transport complex protein n=1 Tax=Elsinoe australis TaxID=40998 RepID=A0A4U7B170_9PEZI|nr:putative outer mitochondrial membrane transport complex protein [Elsinoe australis]
MRLHILGPAFGCPSIDAQCNAAVALVKEEASKQGKKWELVCAVDNFEDLPFLEDEEKLYHGFSSIARHLRDERLPAEHAATEAFIESNGRTLLDVSLYISYENYAAKTRPSFSHILPWYSNYFIPPERRAAARKRTEHLGITGIDMDDVHESVLDQPENMSAAERRFDEETKSRARTLLGRRHTVKSMLRSSAAAGAFKLKNLADNFYEPLVDLLGKNKYLTSDTELSRVDCLAYGYLSLLLYPKVPQAWAAEIMRKEYPSLVQYIHRVRDELHLGVRDEVAQNMLRDTRKDDTGLPWISVVRPAVLRQLTSCGQALLRQTPLSPKSSPVVAEDKSHARSTIHDLLPHAASLTIGTLFLGGWLLYRQGIWPQGEQVHFFGRKRLADYGAAGSALAVLSGFSSHVNSREPRPAQQELLGQAIVDVEVVQ